MAGRTRSIYMQDEQWEALEAEAERSERSVNFLVSRAVRDDERITIEQKAVPSAKK